MPTLLELTSQGDVGTITDESKLSTIKLMNPQQLYELWERQNGQLHTIDLHAGPPRLGRRWTASCAATCPGTCPRSSSARSG